LSAACCASRVCPSVDTLAYPIIAIFYPPYFARHICTEKWLENQGSVFCASVVIYAQRYGRGFENRHPSLSRHRRYSGPPH
jgi:hypothetical protein